MSNQCADVQTCCYITTARSLQLRAERAGKLGTRESRDSVGSTFRQQTDQVLHTQPPAFPGCPTGVYSSYSHFFLLQIVVRKWPRQLQWVARKTISFFCLVPCRMMCHAPAPVRHVSYLLPTVGSPNLAYSQPQVSLNFAPRHPQFSL